MPIRHDADATRTAQSRDRCAGARDMTLVPHPPPAPCLRMRIDNGAAATPVSSLCTRTGIASPSSSRHERRRRERSSPSATWRTSSPRRSDTLISLTTASCAPAPSARPRMAAVAVSWRVAAAVRRLRPVVARLEKWHVGCMRTGALAEPAAGTRRGAHPAEGIATQSRFAPGSPAAMPVRARSCAFSRSCVHSPGRSEGPR